MFYNYLLVALLVGCEAFCQTSTLNDPRDGKKYKTIQIGKQVWMAQNLAYAKKISHNVQLDSPQCFCYADSIHNCDRFGMLYNWEEAIKSCPSGWHLPSKKEFDIMLQTIVPNNGGVKIQVSSEESSGINLPLAGWLYVHEHLPEGHFRSIGKVGMFCKPDCYFHVFIVWRIICPPCLFIKSEYIP